MVSMGDWCPGGRAFESLLRHFFEHFDHYLTWPGVHCGLTVWPPLIKWKNRCDSVVKPFEKWWSIRSGDKHYSGQFVRWFIRAGPSVWWTIRKWVKQPWIAICMIPIKYPEPTYRTSDSHRILPFYWINWFSVFMWILDPDLDILFAAKRVRIQFEQIQPPADLFFII